MWRLLLNKAPRDENIRLTEITATDKPIGPGENSVLVEITNTLARLDPI